MSLSYECCTYFPLFKVTNLHVNVIKHCKSVEKYKNIRKFYCRKV